MYSDSNALLQAQMQAAAQRERWQILSGLQQNIHQMSNEVNLNRAQTADRASNAFTNYIRGW